MRRTRKHIARVINSAAEAEPQFARVVNPATDAPAYVRDLYREFKGREPKQERKFEVAPGTPGLLAQLGGLVEIVTDRRTLEANPRKSKLCADGDGNLYVAGVFGVGGFPKRGRFDLGEVVSATYRAYKPHVVDEVCEYEHFFGDEGGERPRLILRNGYVTFEGGDYRVEACGIAD